ncbi:MAG: hypothetical protein PGMFKBFP_03242 [Anaerolineales bacterium]|nr:hypothetical protein [Anaerolineales bacterium]
MKAKESRDEEDEEDEKRYTDGADLTEKHGFSCFYKIREISLVRVIRVRVFTLPESADEKRDPREPEGQVQRGEAVVSEKVKRDGEKNER